jgi:hypothetical protein
MNSYWFIDLYTLDWGRERVEEALDAAQRLGVTVIRTWAFNSGLPKRRFVYDSRQLAGLDWTVRGLLLDWRDEMGLNWMRMLRCRPLDRSSTAGRLLTPTNNQPTRRPGTALAHAPPGLRCQAPRHQAAAHAGQPCGWGVPRVGA